jgi:cold shock CspA family protein
LVVFVHRTDLQDSCVQREGRIDVHPTILYPNQRVSYELGEGGKGPKATLVELISQ